jgi:intracellular septation protein
MQLLLDIAPLLAFGIAYSLAGLYTATAVLMGVMVLVLIADYARERRISPIHGLSAVLYLAFGTATLLLHNKRFIQLKPTVLFWILGLAFLASFWLGRRTLTERLLRAALGGQAPLQVQDSTWRRLNALWVAFYGLMGALNLLVAGYAEERTWVLFKVFGLASLTLIFLAPQFLWLMRRSAVSVEEARL